MSSWKKIESKDKAGGAPTTIHPGPGRDLASHPATVWLTGLSGAGKTTLALSLHRRLATCGYLSHVLDGDQVRQGLNRDLGYAERDRRENIRRLAEVARIINEAGLTVILSCISPSRADRKLARGIIGSERFLEVHIATPLEVCEKRDVKGLYRRARSGEIPNFTGVTAPYEPPIAPAMAIDTSRSSLDSSTAELMMLFERFQSGVPAHALRWGGNACDQTSENFTQT